MTLERFWTILLKQWKLIVACFLLVGLGAYAGSRLTTPIYQSTVLIQVAVHAGNGGSDINSLLASDQLVQTESQLATSDPVLREVASHHNGLTVEKLKPAVSSTFKLNTQVFQIDVQDPNPEQAAMLANDIANTFIKQQLQLAQQDGMRSRQQVQAELDNTQKQIQTLTNQISQLQAQADAAAIQQQQGDQQALKLNQAPPDDSQVIKEIAGWRTQISGLQTKLSNLQQQYSQWQTILAQFNLTAVQNSDFVRVVQPAQPMSKPVLPNTSINTLEGLAAGLFLGLLLAIIIEQLDTHVRTPEALIALIDRPALTTVWYKKTKDRKTLLNPTGRDINVEAYRILRTNIEFSDMDKPIRTLLVTSAVAEEGKSVVAANLALFMAKAGKNTLLIDADLHRPTQHKLFNIPSDRVGLSNAVLSLRTPNKVNTPTNHQFFNRPSLAPEAPPAQTVALEQFFYSIGIPNLWIMPAGIVPPNPSDLIVSKSMQRLLTLVMNSSLDIIIIDAPPLLGLSDVGVLAPKVDGTLIVSDILHSTKKNIKRMKAQLAQANVNVLGVVINKQPARKKDAAYAYYSEEADVNTKEDAPSNPVQLSPNTPSSSIPTPSFVQRAAQHNNTQTIPPVQNGQLITSAQYGQNVAPMSSLPFTQRQQGKAES